MSKKLWDVEVSLSASWTLLEADSYDEAIEIAKTRLLDNARAEIDVIGCYEIDAKRNRIKEGGQDDA